MGNPITSIIEELIRTEGLSHISAKKQREKVRSNTVSAFQNVEISQLYMILRGYTNHCDERACYRSGATSSSP